MQSLVNILASLSLTGMFLFFIALSLVHFQEFFENRERKRNYDLEELGVRRFAERLHHQKYWFSENKEVLAFITVMTDNMLHGDWKSIDSLRNEWRKELEK